MKKHAAGKTLFTREALRAYGSRVKLFPGVEEWFDRVNGYGKAVGVQVEHYIISSGLKEMIEGTAIAGKFKKIYASSFLFDENGVGIWPAMDVNYTNKTQFLFRIEKGVLDVNDQRINDHFPSDRLRVPFRNMIYIGDSDTDIPCMKLVDSHGGYSIGIFNKDTNDKTKVYKMMRDERIKYFVPSDYSEGAELDVLVKNIIERTAKNEVLEREYYACLNEVNEKESEKENEKEKEGRKKTELILSLEASRSFAQTHKVIGQMAKIEDWTEDEIKTIARISLSNTQVRYVIKDKDVKHFLGRIIEGMHTKTIEDLREQMK